MAKPADFRRLIEVELRDKRNIGICFKCDGKWNVGYRCKTPELQVIVVQDEVYSDYEDDGEVQRPPTEGLEITEAQVVEVSLNSVVGLTAPKTMKLLGSIHGNEVVTAELPITSSHLTLLPNSLYPFR